MFSNNHQVPRGAKAVHLTNQPKHYLRDSNITYITQTFLTLLKYYLCYSNITYVTQTLT